MPPLLREAGRYDRLIKRFENAVREYECVMLGAFSKEEHDNVKKELRLARKALREFVQR